MQLSQTILISVGTRPEIIKMAPVYHALAACPGLKPVLLHTGQHDELAWPIYQFFGIYPDIKIPLARLHDSLSALKSSLLLSIGKVLEAQRPSAVLVHGDTASALAAAQAAYYLKIPLGHVEAGLRSHQEYDPFPEEKHRELIARLASWNFAPTDRARENLLAEGISPARVYHCGNTIVDAAQWGLSRLRHMQTDDSLQTSWVSLGLVPEDTTVPSVLVTMHRRENWSKVAQLSEAIARILAQAAQIHIIWPLHPNPQLQRDIRSSLDARGVLADPRLQLCDALEYPDMLRTMRDSTLVLTDSGGIQEECVALGKPVLILRETTERPELLDCGLGRLVGLSPDLIVEETLDVLRAERECALNLRAHNPFGDGRASQRIASIIAHELGVRLGMAHEVSFYDAQEAS